MAANNTSLRFLGADEFSKSSMIKQTSSCVSFIGNIPAFNRIQYFNKRHEHFRYYRFSHKYTKADMA